MRLLKVEDGSFSLTKVYANGDDDIPPYAILSHTWGDKEDEISMADIKENRFKQKAAYRKLLFCSTRANADGLKYIWADTCCINQSDTVELTRSINSMFRWYQNAAKCYAYLADVPRAGNTYNNSNNNNNTDNGVSFGNSSAAAVVAATAASWELAFRQSRWFTRGWTLQELLAPRSVEFISCDGIRLGDKATLEQEIHRITGIDLAALRGGDLSNFSFEQRMSWAAGRQTKEEEDIVYSLLGIFGVFLPLIYGEGKDHAHKRLRAEIEKLPTAEKPQPAAAFFRTESVERPTTASVGSWDFCDKCNEYGHHANDVHCYKCKMYGHYANAAHCYECGEYGHFAAEHRSQEFCNNCGEYGHRPQDVHCYKCGVYGHYKPDCPEDDDSEDSDY
ncbi:heterokaryon incompatibility protein-domain-containing protein [Xylaria cf. heliscus]|nr:heterokaryon incompatibility protein-domain-containing protein [Xylaria cf. heliscus]